MRLQFSLKPFIYLGFNRSNNTIVSVCLEDTKKIRYPSGIPLAGRLYFRNSHLCRPNFLSIQCLLFALQFITKTVFVNAAEKKRINVLPQIIYNFSFTFLLDLKIENANDLSLFSSNQILHCG